MHNVGVLTPDDLRACAKYNRLIPDEVVAYAGYQRSTLGNYLCGASVDPIRAESSKPGG